MNQENLHSNFRRKRKRSFCTTGFEMIVSLSFNCPLKKYQAMIIIKAVVSSKSNKPSVVILILLTRTPAVNVVLLSVNCFINQLEQSGWISKNLLLQAELVSLRFWVQVALSVTSVPDILYWQRQPGRQRSCAVCCSVTSRDRIPRSRQQESHKPQDQSWECEVRCSSQGGVRPIDRTLHPSFKIVRLEVLGSHKSGW